MMKFLSKIVGVFVLFSLFSTGVYAQDSTRVKVITIVESIVPMGAGRSRIIEHQEDINVGDFTTKRNNGKKSKQGSIKRQNAKIDQLSETKLLNFYSGLGINFQNIASNDALISAKINEMLAKGWKLNFVTSGVESNAGETDAYGIFITRLFFSQTFDPNE